MPKKLAKFIDIPDGVDVQIDGSMLKVFGSKGKLERGFWYPSVFIEKIDSSVKVDSKVQKGREKAIIGTFASHIANMVTGVTDGFEYRLKIVYSHFPIQVKIAGNEVLITNFLGERKDRRANIVGSSKVEIDGDEVIVTGINKEEVGQTAANIEQATKIRRFDPRVFQDGIYITFKGGKHVV